jgi:hypothetical protein
MNLAGKRILVCGGRDFTHYPSSCGTLDGLFPALVLRPSDKVIFTARHPVPIVDEALLALQQLGWPKGHAMFSACTTLADTRGRGGDVRRLLESSAAPKIDHTGTGIRRCHAAPDRDWATAP